jgi:hypothetical protein
MDCVDSYLVLICLTNWLFDGLRFDDFLMYEETSPVFDKEFQWKHFNQAHYPKIN